MPHLHANQATAKLVPLFDLFRRDRSDYAETAYTVFAFSITMLLIGLALRTMFALFVVNNPFSRGITIFTDPFIAPFNGMFHDAHQMVQVSTATAFSVYLGFYFAVARIHQLLQRDTKLYQSGQRQS